ncbi:uracil phosphoribosyltransferase [Roseomonas genomospecies 6]|uniref:Uracil phosphoribosyltransferase n=1 Tax=Roseomonas genomospecies 6 TaxID=214106 RepID=A0A9W7NG95_9PROT|nr:uracil phosphoribosyltransferase [Roseomonas genomospecies 6]KAA0675798.1 uracil phosphoribosyltransferase [Roseomonas genomospecies 6]
MPIPTLPIPTLTVIDHPLVQHKLTLLRRRETPTARFHEVMREVSQLMGYELTRDLPLESRPVETPLASFDAPLLTGKKLCLVSILRAGQGLLDGMRTLLPSARIGHIGLYRDQETLTPVEYFFKVPEDIEERSVILVDPMLATGHTATAAVHRLKDAGAAAIKLAVLVAAPEGLRNFHDAHPDVPVYAAAVDERLDGNGYILPGLGDAGDRLYGTR